MICKNHQDQAAACQCEKCQGYFCNSCAIIRKISDEFTAYICKECGGKCEPLAVGTAKTKKADARDKKPIEIVRVKTPETKRDILANISVPRHLNFWFRLPGIFIFPLKGRGIPILIFASALCYGLFELQQFSKIAGLIFSVVFISYFLIFLFKVAEDSFNGFGSLQSLPGLHYWIKMAGPILWITSAVIFYLAPAHVYFIYRSRFDLIYFFLLGAGLFLLPMSLAEIVISRKLHSLNPVCVVGGIAKTSAAYFIMYFLMLGFVLSIFYFNSEFSMKDQRLSLAICQLFMVYILLIEARLLGVFANSYQEKLMATFAKGVR